MASNHTEQYQLNQWEAADQVLRTDFNEDNAKIEAALKEKVDYDIVLTIAKEVGGANQKIKDLETRIAALESK